MSELGEALKRAREEKNISLEELEASTKIQKRYLQAVERGEYDRLPGRFYARAFIKRYAEAIGLNANELFEQYSGEVPEAKEEIVEQLPSRSERMSNRVSRSSKWPSILPKLLAVVVIVGLLAAVWIGIQHVSRNSGAHPSNQQNDSGVEFSKNPGANHETTSNQKKQPSKKQPGEKNKEKPKKQQSEQVLKKTGEEGNTVLYTLENTGQFKLNLEVTGGNSWIEVIGSDGKKYEYGMFDSGKTITQDLSKAEKVTVKIGNTANVKMSINGEPFTYPNDNTVQKFLITYKGKAS